MLRRLRLVLIALAVAVAAALPAGARTMPMPTLAAGSAIQPPCTLCTNEMPAGPGHHRMPACPVFACIGAAAVLPAAAALPQHVLRPIAYAVAPPVRWRSAQPDPDPIPPRPAARV